MQHFHRVATAFALSVLLHGLLVAAMNRGAQKQATPDGRGRVHAVLRIPGAMNGAMATTAGPARLEHPLPAPSNGNAPNRLVARKEPVAEPRVESAATPPPPAPPALPSAPPQGWQSGGAFRLRPPAPDTALMLAMQQAMLAQQRAAQGAAMNARIGALALSMEARISGKLDCVEAQPGELSCTPAPDESIAPLLRELLALAHELRRLGIGASPLRLDFGPDRELTLTLR